ncbi:MAG: hypothetical protein WC461_01990 [Candidatus Paceibacterota bacterium]
MEEQNLLLDSPKKSKYLKFVAGFLGIIILFAGGYFIWDRYLSPEARLDREREQGVQKYLDLVKNYEDAMKNDTYGGKTPEETLKMFIDALKNDDVELASKYFVLDENGKVNPKWIKGLQDTKDAGRFQGLATLLSGAIADEDNSTSAEDFKFKAYENNVLKAYVNMQFNKYSGIWKIESM